MTRRSNGTGAITKAGYIIICENMAYKYEHVRVAEKALGKPLPVGAIVHHVDENPSNNTNANLVICRDAKYHRLLHRRTDAMNACGNPNYVVCRYCKSYDDPANMQRDGSRSHAHSACRSQYRRKLYAQGRRNV